MTVKDFINKYFIEEIGSLVEKRPFVSFVLMAIGIEFLGKCLNPNKWNDDTEIHKDNFYEAIRKFDSLNKYDIPVLYKNLRCGLAHRFMVEDKIMLTPDKNNLTGSIIILGCKDFYADFKQACLDAIEDKKMIVKKDLNKEYDFEIGGITGSTISN